MTEFCNSIINVRILTASQKNSLFSKNSADLKHKFNKYYIYSMIRIPMNTI